MPFDSIRLGYDRGHVLFGDGELCGERGAGSDWREDTLTKVKHRRKLLFAALPTMFAVHQFLEGFVWLGLDGMLGPNVTHGAGEAYVLWAQGLLPFPMPLSVILFEAKVKDRRRMLPFVVLGGGIWCGR